MKLKNTKNYFEKHTAQGFFVYFFASFIMATFLSGCTIHQRDIDVPLEYKVEEQSSAHPKVDKKIALVLPEEFKGFIFIGIDTAFGSNKHFHVGQYMEPRLVSDSQLIFNKVTIVERTHELIDNKNDFDLILVPEWGNFSLSPPTVTSLQDGVIQGELRVT